MVTTKSGGISMESPQAFAEHLEGADECTVESLGCVRVRVESSKKSTEDLEEIDDYIESSSARYGCATVKPALKPTKKPTAAFHCSANFPPSGVFAFLSPPKPTDALEVGGNKTADSSSYASAFLKSPQKCAGQRDAANWCSVDSGNTDVQHRRTIDLIPSDIHISKRSLRKQAKQPKPVAVSMVDSAPSSTEASMHKQKKPSKPCMRPQKCNVCQKIVCNKAVLKVHLRTHTGEKPYPCPMCPEKFATTNHLHCHKRTHTGEKPYSCEVCGWRFSQNSNLRRHMLTHTGERPHACSVCEKRFTQRATLQLHLRTHTGERPFPCSMCPAVFRYRDALQRHRVKHKGEGEGYKV